MKGVTTKKSTDPLKQKNDPKGVFEWVILNLLSEPKAFKQSLLSFDKDNIR